LPAPNVRQKLSSISFIENEKVIKKILKHLGLWDLKSKPPPRANTPPHNIEPHLDYSDCQLPPPARHLPARALQWQAGRSRSGEAGGSYDYLYGDEQYL